MGQLGAQWTEFNETRHLSTLQKCVGKTEVRLKSEKYNGQFTHKPTVCAFRIVDYIAEGLLE